MTGDAPRPTISSIAPRYTARAEKTADLWHFPATMDNGWSKSDKELGSQAYMKSAMAGRQWPQARCATARSAGWTRDPTCRLCKGAPGTMAHRHVCPAIVSQTPHLRDEQLPPEALALCTIGRAELWRDRGIGAVKIQVPSCTSHDWDRWIKTPPSYINQSDICWYIDASQIDADDPRTAAQYHL